MGNRLLKGFWRLMIPVPGPLWEKRVADARKHIQDSLGFMGEDHHAVRNFAVRELPVEGRPLAPGLIAERLDLPLERVNAILDDLEKHMTFLFRGDGENVTWAYPVTVDETPHRVTFDSGETLYAAWGIDAVATPFVQGHLRNEKLTVNVETSCAHCGEKMHLTIDSDLKWSVEEDASPMLFRPDVDFAKLEDPSIIDAFWREAVFLWSEEHAREYRRTTHRKPGAYFTVDQMAWLTPLVQGALFSFELDSI